MRHQFVHACAGSGKTQHVIDHCSQGPPNIRRLIITLTLAGQDELEGRLRKDVDPSAPTPEVMGWFSFLINHIVRPYLPLLFPEQRVTGFIFHIDDASVKKALRYKKKTDPRRFFSEAGMIYKDNLEDLAAEIFNKARGLVENRLRLIYDEICCARAFSNTVVSIG